MTFCIAGIDEAGRGPLAGPLFAAAVILNSPIIGLTDSKKLSPKKREQFAVLIQQKALDFAYGIVSHEEIDELNIHHATLLAMKRALEGLTYKPDMIRVDGCFVPKTTIPARAIVRGDSLFPEISAASILAKVKRDAAMFELDDRYPGYGFKQHKGYPTSKHLEALHALGPSPIHRMSFAPLSKWKHSLI